MMHNLNIILNCDQIKCHNFKIKNFNDSNWISRIGVTKK